MYFFKVFFSINLFQGLLFVLFFLPSLILVEYKSLDEGFYLICIYLAFCFIFLYFLRGLGPMVSVVSVSRPFINISLVRLALCSFIVLNLIRFLRIVEAGTHQVLYTDSSFVLFDLPLKVLAFPAYYLAISRLMITRSLADEKLAILSVISVLLTGSRGLAVFGFISIILYRLGLGGIFRLRYIFLGFFMVFIFLMIGFFREPIDMDIQSYIILVLASLNEFAVSSLNVNQCGIEPALVFQQFNSLLLGIIDYNRVTFLLTECVSPGAISHGYGIASSVIAESMIISPDRWYLVFIIVISANSIFASLLITSNYSVLRTVGLAWLPFVLYSVRTEIIYPYIFLLKIFTAVTMLAILQLFLKAFSKRLALV